MPNAPRNYDFVIIGGGPAGVNGAVELGQHSKSVVLINNEPVLGGAGVNTGTIPSKTLRETALALSGLRSRNLYGVDLSLKRDITVTDFLGHEQHVREAFNHSLADQVQASKVDVIVGAASFIDPHTFEVKPIKGGPQETVTIRGDKILLATGSSPNRPELFFSQPGEIYDSDSVLELDHIPKNMAVIGSGVIGSEYACIFAALGAKVHIIDGHAGLMPFVDPEIVQALTSAMGKVGITFHWNETVTKCEPIENDGVKLTLLNEPPLSVDTVLVAAGRHSNVADLNLAAAGVAMDKKGTVLVDGTYKTNVPHIFSAGDIIGFPALASTSMAQGRLAVRHALGLEDPALAPVLPTGIYTIPEISFAGESEASAQKNNIPVVVGHARYAGNARGRIIGDVDGFLKLIFRRDDMQLIGVHVIGEQATEIVHIGLLGILTNIKAELLVDICFNVPTLSMLYKAAALDAIRQVAKP
jgi:NAD(P) transhydrogenase